MLRIWRVAMTAACGALAAGNFLHLEDEGATGAVVAHVSLGLAWAVAGAWVFFGCEE